MKVLYYIRSQSPPSPSDHALNQLVKGFQIAMHKFIFSKKENKDLWAANEKQKQKRTHSRRQITHEEGLSVSKAHELIEASIKA